MDLATFITRATFHYPGGQDHDQKNHAGDQWVDRGDNAVEGLDPHGMMARVRRKGGFTYQPVLRSEPTTGYIVSILKEREEVFDGVPDEGAFASFMSKNSDMLRRDPTAYIGAWYDPEANKTYLDISTRVGTKQGAIDLAKRYDQEGIYDIEAGQTIITKEASKRRLTDDARRFSPWLYSLGDGKGFTRCSGEIPQAVARALFHTPGGVEHDQEDHGNWANGTATGDEWNRATRERLATQYAAAKPKIEALKDKLVSANEVDVSEPVNMDDAPFVPDEWITMGEDQQALVFEHWKTNNWDAWVEGEIESWRESSMPDEQLSIVAEQFSKGDNTEWAEEAIAEWRDGLESPIPYSDEQILNALNIEHDSGWNSERGTSIEIDREKLGLLEGWKYQMDLPGMDGGSIAIPADAEKDLTDTLVKSMVERAEKIEVYPPDYLSENLAENMQDYFNGLPDEDKFNIASHDTSIIKDAQQEYDDFVAGIDPASIKLTEPAKYDPLQTSAYEATPNYKNTQQMAMVLSEHRAAEIMRDRGLMKEAEAYGAIRRADAELWNSWKDSSTSPDGWLLQVATADELGGRLREHPEFGGHLNVAGARKYADAAHADIGGYEGVKALVRAKWETTQFMLERAGIEQVDVYRGVAIVDFNKKQELASTPRVTVEVAGTNSDMYTKLPEIHLERNGAASSSLDPAVANDWRSGNPNRVVIRARVPRTAVLSVPAYGRNIHAEREVVIAGTAWDHWDAWLEKAPTFEQVAP